MLDIFHWKGEVFMFKKEMIMFDTKKLAFASAFTFAVMFFLKKMFILFVTMIGFMPKFALMFGRSGMVGSEEVMMVYEKGGIGFGCTASWGGIFVGTLWFFVVGYISGLLFGWFYNKLTVK